LCYAVIQQVPLLIPTVHQKHIHAILVPLIATCVQQDIVQMTMAALLVAIAPQDRCQMLVPNGAPHVQEGQRKQIMSHATQPMSRRMSFISTDGSSSSVCTRCPAGQTCNADCTQCVDPNISMTATAAAGPTAATGMVATTGAPQDERDGAVAMDAHFQESFQHNLGLCFVVGLTDFTVAPIPSHCATFEAHCSSW